MRLGPKPLPFQLGMASLASAGLAGGTHFDPETLQAFFKGIQKYQSYPYERNIPALRSVWSAGTASLYICPPTERKYSIPIVLIPSMVNKADILDLLPDRSLVRWLAGQGFEVYLFDWGTPRDDPGQQDCSKAMDERLLPALRSIGKEVQLLGYCMGGLFAAATCTLLPEIVRGAVFLAMPWNFHDQAAALKARMTIMKPMAVPYMKQYHHLPESWMQAVFATLDPEGSIRKFSSFATMPDNDPRADMFVAVEDWLNNGVDLPAGIAAECMDQWYEENRPYKGEWTVCHKNVSARSLRTPTFVVAASEDRIVPPDSALAFADQRVKGDRLICKTGHVGLIAGRSAMGDIWKPIADWFAVQQ